MANLTERDFNSDPRARDIRQACLRIADAFDALLTQPGTIVEGKIALIREQYQLLVSMGVTRHYMCGLEPQAYETPSVLAGYVGGQWVDALEDGLPDHLRVVFLRSYINMTYRFLGRE